jgi:hypothetical protein
MPARKKPSNTKASKKKLGKKQIIRAIHSIARKLGRSPIQAEFVRMSGIDITAVKRQFGWYPRAVRAAGLATQSGQKVDSGAILQDWAEVARKLGHIPNYYEYAEEGRYGASGFRRFGGWALIPDAYLRFIESGGLEGEWEDVTAMVRKHATRNNKEDYRPGCQNAFNGFPPMRQIPPPEVAGKRCVTATMLGVFLAQVMGAQFWSSGAIYNRHVLPDRPLLGPPLHEGSMTHAPVNEMGVIILFAMWAERLGFVIEFAQTKFPDCKAKMEVEPGRWQDVDVEFEWESMNFKFHRHDAKKMQRPGVLAAQLEGLSGGHHGGGAEQGGEKRRLVIAPCSHDKSCAPTLRSLVGGTGVWRS